MATIVEIKGNIFDSTCQVLVNTVNCVGVMGKGIALEFKRRFPEMYESYVKMCQRSLLKPGLLYLWTKSKPWILNFPTKDHWRYPSKIEYIDAGLQKFVTTYQSRNITTIAFPELGTQSGKLEWNLVREYMYRYLEPLPNLNVEIYHFDPTSDDTLFDKLYQKICHFTLEDYISYLGLNKKQAELLRLSITQNSIHSMRELQHISGLGKKSFEQIYSFLEEPAARTMTGPEKQLGLF